MQRRPNHTQPAPQGPNTASLADAAVMWAAILPVFPLHGIDPDGACTCGNEGCKSPGKHPRIGGWQRAASQDPDIVRDWWARWPNSNVGGATGHGIHVVDVDGPEGMSNIEKWKLPNTIWTRTGRGRHLYFTEPEGFRAGNTQGGDPRSLGLSVDTRGSGGYVVLPPSKHELGHRYELVDGDIAELPENVRDHLCSGTDSTPDLPLDVPHRAATPTADAQYATMVSAICDRIAAAGAGSRHRQIRNGSRLLAGYYHLQGAMSAEEVLEFVDSAVDRAYSTDGDPVGGKRTARDGWRHGLADPIPALPGQLRTTPDGRPYFVAFPGKDGMYVATPGEDLGGHGRPSYSFQTKGMAVSRLLNAWPGIQPFVPKADGSGVRRMNPIEAFESFGGAWANEVVHSYVKPSGFDSESGVLTIQSSLGHRPKPVFHAEIERWLEALAGPDLPILKAWLATYPEVDRPTAGLVLVGPGGTGKSLLTQGLAAYFGTGWVAYEDAVGPFNGKLLHSPLVRLDEATPDIGKSGPFRSLLANSEHRLRIMYQPPMTLEGCPRLIVTANEPDPLGLARGNHTLDSQHAIGVRLRHIKAREEAREYLRELGGADYTYANEWPKRIAEHIEYLHLNEAVTRGDRLLVEGSGKDYVRDIASREGLAGQVREILVDLLDRMLEAASPKDHEKSTEAMTKAELEHQVVIFRSDFPGQVLVSGRNLRANWARLSGEDRAPGWRDIGSALETLTGGKEPDRRRFTSGARLRLHVVDLDILRDED